MTTRPRLAHSFRPALLSALLCSSRNDKYLVTEEATAGLTERAVRHDALHEQLSTRFVSGFGLGSVVGEVSHSWLPSSSSLLFREKQNTPHREKLSPTEEEAGGREGDGRARRFCVNAEDALASASQRACVS